MASLADLVVRVTSDVKGVQVGMAKTRAELQKTQKEADETGKHFKASNALIAAGALGVAGAIGKFALASVGTYKDWGAQLRNIQRLTGATAEQAGNLFAAMRLTVGPAADIGSGLAFYAKNLGAAHAGSGTQYDDFKKLGIALKDTNGEWRTGADILPELRNKLAALKDPSDRARIASELLGRGYKTLLPYLTASSQAMADNQKFLNSLGFGVSSKDMADFMKFAGDEKKMAFAQQYMQFQMGKLIAQLENKVMPTLLRFMALLNHIPSGLILAVGAFAGLVGAIKGAQTVMEAFNGVRGLLGMERAAGEVGPVLGGLRGVFGGVASGIGAGVRAMGNWIAAVPGIVAANITLIASFAVVAAGVYAIVKAYQAWQAAAAQAAEAAANSASADTGAQAKVAAWQQAHPGQPLPASYQKLLDYSNQNPTDYQAPSGAGGWMKSWYDYMSNDSGLAWALPSFASGGTAKAPASGGLALLHGVERITPVGQEKPSVVVNVNGNTFVGTSRDAEEHIGRMVERRLGRHVARLERGVSLA